MLRHGLSLSVLLLSGCLDFDQFETRPTGSSSAAGGGGAGGGQTTGVGGMGGDAAGGSGGTGGGTGGSGGAGGGVQLPPCGGLEDDFDGGATLDWMPISGNFINDEAFAQPPSAVFRLASIHATQLADCAVHLEITQSTAGEVYFAWSLDGDPFKIFRLVTLNESSFQVQLADDAGTVTALPLVDSTPFTSGAIRVSNRQDEYVIETADSPSGDWVVRAAVPEASAPAWLAEPGVATFGIYGSTGGPARFDNFNTF